MEKLENIYIHLKNNYQEYSRVGTLNGLSGIALFQSYYERKYNIQQDQSLETIDYCIKKINEENLPSSYCNGIAGFAWLLQHLEENQFVSEGEFSETLSILDTYLEGELSKYILENNYDFLHGALGYIFYFLKRSKKADCYKNQISILFSNLPEIYSTITHHHLSKISMHEMVEGKQKNRLHFGLAHGIASIIAILCLCHDKGYFREQSKEWIEKFIFLLSQHEMQPESESKFPLWMDLETGEKSFSSLSWCSGDIGIAMAFMKASRISEDSAISHTLSALLKKSAQRKEHKNAMIKNYGICHGYFGASRIFSRVYNDTLSEEYRETSIFWLNKGINALTFAKDSPMSILNGLSGAGLVLMDFHHNELNSWDECLLIS
ncbi:lanthionine synthetase LanC family protein [Chryseobacterium sp. JK1]|uniref:lanthionine synthetase LanC family protein n=1 Tax=Chryseobacterium sp. JK1 TaxID=874294 RepID=UPI003D6903D4